MEPLPPPDDKSPGPRKGSGASLVVRLNRAAGDLNPFLVVVAIGLLILDVTLYIGLSVTREPMIWTAPRQTGEVVAPANATPEYNTDAPGAGPARS